MEQFLKKRVIKNHKELVKFDRAKIYNVDKAKNIADNLNEIMALTSGMLFCANTQISINECLDNTSVAIDIREKTVDFLSAVGEYVDFFLKAGIEYNQLLLNKMYMSFNIDSKMNYIGDLDARIKCPNVKDLASHPLIEKIIQEKFGNLENLLKVDKRIMNKTVKSSLFDSINIELASHMDDLLIASEVVGQGNK